MFRLGSTYVSTELDLCFDWPLAILAELYLSGFDLSTFFSRSNWVAFDFASIGYVSIVLDVCFDCDQSIFRLILTYVSTAFDLCFNFAWPIVRVSWLKSDMFRLCLTYRLTFLIKIRYVSTELDLCFDCVWHNFIFSTKLRCNLTVLDLWLKFPGQIRVSNNTPGFDLSMLLVSRSKLGMFRLCSMYVLAVIDLHLNCSWPIFWLCSTYVSTELDLCF